MESQDSRRFAAALEHLAHQGDAGRVASMAVALWKAITAALGPVIGPGGVAALYDRSLHLARRNHPWLAALPENLDGGMDLAALGRLLEQQSAAAAAAGGAAHLQALHELLGSLIGPALTDQLLQSASASSFSGPAAQDPSR